MGDAVVVLEAELEFTDGEGMGSWINHDVSALRWCKIGREGETDRADRRSSMRVGEGMLGTVEVFYADVNLY